VGSDDFSSTAVPFQFTQDGCQRLGTILYRDSKCFQPVPEYIPASSPGFGL